MTGPIRVTGPFDALPCVHINRLADTRIIEKRDLVAGCRPAEGTA